MSRLTVDHFSSSFSFFRQARTDRYTALKAGVARGWRSVALQGISDLSEVAIICAMDAEVTVRVVVDPESTQATYLNTPVVPSLEQVVGQVDAFAVAKLEFAQATTDAASRLLSSGRVPTLTLLNVRIDREVGAAE